MNTLAKQSGEKLSQRTTTCVFVCQCVQKRKEPGIITSGSLQQHRVFQGKFSDKLIDFWKNGAWRTNVLHSILQSRSLFHTWDNANCLMVSYFRVIEMELLTPYPQSVINCKGVMNNICDVSSGLSPQKCKFIMNHIDHIYHNCNVKTSSSSSIEYFCYMLG